MVPGVPGGPGSGLNERPRGRTLEARAAWLPVAGDLPIPQGRTLDELTRLPVDLWSMAQPQPQKSAAAQKPLEPEVRLFGLIHRGPAMWSVREVIVQGDRILAQVDSEPDARAPTIGRIVRRLEKVVP